MKRRVRINDAREVLIGKKLRYKVSADGKSWDGRGTWCPILDVKKCWSINYCSIYSHSKCYGILLKALNIRTFCMIEPCGRNDRLHYRTWSKLYELSRRTDLR